MNDCLFEEHRRVTGFLIRKFSRVARDARTTPQELNGRLCLTIAGGHMGPPLHMRWSGISHPPVPHLYRFLLLPTPHATHHATQHSALITHHSKSPGRNIRVNQKKCCYPAKSCYKIKLCNWCGNGFQFGI